MGRPDGPSHPPAFPLPQAPHCAGFSLPPLLPINSNNQDCACAFCFPLAQNWHSCSTSEMLAHKRGPPQSKSQCRNGATLLQASESIAHCPGLLWEARDAHLPYHQRRNGGHHCKPCKHCLQAQDAQSQLDGPVRVEKHVCLALSCASLVVSG